MKSLDIVQLSEIPDESQEDTQWKNTYRIGIAEYDQQTLEIKLHVYENGHTYNIDLERRDTLESWLEHLNGKNWGTSQVLGDLVKCWFRVGRETAI